MLLSQALRFFSSSNVTVEGLKVQNSPQFHFRFDQCRYVTVASLRISSPATSPNTDGIHVEAAENVLIHDSVISNGNKTKQKKKLINIFSLCMLLN